MLFIRNIDYLFQFKRNFNFRFSSHFQSKIKVMMERLAEEEEITT